MTQLDACNAFLGTSCASYGHLISELWTSYGPIMAGLCLGPEPHLQYRGDARRPQQRYYHHLSPQDRCMLRALLMAQLYLRPYAGDAPECCVAMPTDYGDRCRNTAQYAMLQLDRLDAAMYTALNAAMLYTMYYTPIDETAFKLGMDTAPKLTAMRRTVHLNPDTAAQKLNVCALCMCDNRDDDAPTDALVKHMVTCHAVDMVRLIDRLPLSATQLMTVIVFRATETKTQDITLQLAERLLKLVAGTICLSVHQNTTPADASRIVAAADKIAREAQTHRRLSLPGPRPCVRPAHTLTDGIYGVMTTLLAEDTTDNCTDADPPLYPLICHMTTESAQSLAGGTSPEECQIAIGRVMQAHRQHLLRSVPHDHNPRSELTSKGQYHSIIGMPMNVILQPDVATEQALVTSILGGGTEAATAEPEQVDTMCSADVQPCDVAPGPAYMPPPHADTRTLHSLSPGVWNMVGQMVPPCAAGTPTSVCAQLLMANDAIIPSMSNTSGRRRVRYRRTPRRIPRPPPPSDGGTAITLPPAPVTTHADDSTSQQPRDVATRPLYMPPTPVTTHADDSASQHPRDVATRPVYMPSTPVTTYADDSASQQPCDVAPMPPTSTNTGPLHNVSTNVWTMVTQMVPPVTVTAVQPCDVGTPTSVSVQLLTAADAIPSTSADTVRRRVRYRRTPRRRSRPPASDADVCVPAPVVGNSGRKRTTSADRPPPPTHADDSVPTAPAPAVSNSRRKRKASGSRQPPRKRLSWRRATSADAPPLPVYIAEPLMARPPTADTTAPSISVTLLAPAASEERTDNVSRPRRTRGGGIRTPPDTLVMPRDRKVLVKRPECESPWSCQAIVDEAKLRSLMEPIPQDADPIWKRQADDADVEERRCTSASCWRHAVLCFYGPAIDDIRARYALLTDTTAATSFGILAANLCPGKDVVAHRTIVTDYVKRYCIHPMYVDPARPINDNIYRRGPHVLAVINALMCLDTSNVSDDERARFVYTMTLGDRGYAAMGLLLAQATDGAVCLSLDNDMRAHRLVHVLYLALMLECARFAKCAVPLTRYSATHIDTEHVEHILEGARALDLYDTVPTFAMEPWYTYYGVHDVATTKGGQRDDKQLNAVCLHVMALAYVSVAVDGGDEHIPRLPDDYAFEAGRGPPWVPTKYLSAIQETISVRRKDITALSRVAARGLVSLVSRVPGTPVVTYESLRSHLYNSGQKVCARQYLPFVERIARRLRPVLCPGVEDDNDGAYSACLRLLAGYVLDGAV